VKRALVMFTAVIVGAVMAAAAAQELDLRILQPMLWDPETKSAIAVVGYRWETTDVVTSSGDTVRALLLVER